MSYAPTWSCHRCLGPLVTKRREILPAQSQLPLLRPEHRLKGKSLTGVSVEACRFMELKCVREELSNVWRRTDRGNYDPISRADVATWWTRYFTHVISCSPGRGQRKQTESAYCVTLQSLCQAYCCGWLCGWFLPLTVKHLSLPLKPPKGRKAGREIQITADVIKKIPKTFIQSVAFNRVTCSSQ